MVISLSHINNYCYWAQVNYDCTNSIKECVSVSIVKKIKTQFLVTEACSYQDLKLNPLEHIKCVNHFSNPI